MRVLRCDMRVLRCDMRVLRCEISLLGCDIGDIVNGEGRVSLAEEGVDETDAVVDLSEE